MKNTDDADAGRHAEAAFALRWNQEPHLGADDHALLARIRAAQSQHRSDQISTMTASRNPDISSEGI